MAKAAMIIPHDVFEKLRAGKTPTREDLDAITWTGPVCDVCCKAVDTSKRVSDGEKTSDEDLLGAEVIVHTTDKGEHGCDNRYYHADCYWKEQEEGASDA